MIAPPARRRTAALVVASLAVAGCGGSGGSSSKSPSGRLDAVAKALKKTKSVHVEGTQTDKDGPSRLDGDINANGDARLGIRQANGEELAILRVDKVDYLKANAAYWTMEADPRVAGALADKWVKAPASAEGEFGKQLAPLLPSGLARCVKSNLGTLKSDGTANVDGTDTDVVEDLGDKPGTEPGKIFIARGGSGLPVRVVQTGARKPGGKLDTFCSDKDDTDTAEDIRLTFGKPVKLTAPPRPIDLDALHQGAGTGGVGGQAA